MNQGRDEGFFNGMFTTDYINLVFSSGSQKQTTAVTVKESETVHLAPSVVMHDNKPIGEKHLYFGGRKKKLKAFYVIHYKHVGRSQAISA